ncbi:LysR substrate-binding domain-containing protein [Paraburkholderia silvatlantica]|uniref:DNA-binding transcriptional LysR family regulator n=1 Tax=Paraburkholderia silvatlantica TaxID=321895 RepID=A0A2U1AHS4_9BURK|nr:LysR substrate-binding domain-containing protein [Paraburkholderia silvatlantica]MBB2929346.1 DNA-binding transcriptional LysR family regulator [Paraburkholderia silvatlantica]PVY35962.1 LysR family transcriptional regulator [Paraburkholderia silvatlantica]PXW39910.1 LysR family transcriptional regulator [Paraburkholderia silvatlantica]PYE19742.1 LysR family transcriptional regulator [Paraburkholderia silvatlantica]TDQ99534.1 LysR family transcriptional regulator [Paraburkholderia silvatlan
MTPEQLITFAAVAEHLNISRAALALHLSQPAVSGQLRLLQDEIGEPLYQRDGRGVRLTPTGEQLAGYAARLRDTWRDALAYRDALRGLERGTLRIGATTTPASYRLPYLVARFHGRYPQVKLETSSGNTTDIVSMLGAVDIALIEGPVGEQLPPDTAVHPWHEDEIVAIVPRSHALASQLDAQGEMRAPMPAITVEALAQWPLVLREDGSGVRQVVERAFARAGVPMRVALEIAGVEGVKEAVRAGMGIGFVSAMSMHHENGALRQISLGPAPLARRFSILVPHAGAASRVAQRFLELCLADVPGV